MATRISTLPFPAAPAVAVAVGAIAAGVLVEAWAVGSVAPLLALALLPAAAAAVVDLQRGRVPDLLVVLTAAVPLVMVAVGVASAVTVVAGAALASVSPLAVHLARPAWMGFGDVKLAAALGGVLAPLDVRAGMLAVAVGAACTLTVALVRRLRAVPFAPGLVAGALVALVALSTLGWEAPAWR